MIIITIIIIVFAKMNRKLVLTFSYYNHLKLKMVVHYYEHDKLNIDIHT